MRFSSAVLLALLGCAKPAASPDGIVFGTPHALVHFVAPKIDGVDLDGRTVDANALAGRVAVVRFWATWAPHSRDSIVSLARLYDRYGAERVRIVAVSVDAEAPAAEEIVNVVGARFTVASDPLRELARRWSVAHVPTTFVIDSVGIVRAVFTSDDPSKDEPAIERDIEILLGRPVPSDGKIHEPREGSHATR
jgi:peroxiredoxin